MFIDITRSVNVVGLAADPILTFHVVLIATIYRLMFAVVLMGTDPLLRDHSCSAATT